MPIDEVRVPRVDHRADRGGSYPGGDAVGRDRPVDHGVPGRVVERHEHGLAERDRSIDRRGDSKLWNGKAGHHLSTDRTGQIRRRGRGNETNLRRRSAVDERHLHVRARCLDVGRQASDRVDRRIVRQRWILRRHPQDEVQPGRRERSPLDDGPTRRPASGGRSAASGGRRDDRGHDVAAGGDPGARSADAVGSGIGHSNHDRRRGDGGDHDEERGDAPPRTAPTVPGRPSSGAARPGAGGASRSDHGEPSSSDAHGSGDPGSSRFRSVTSSDVSTRAPPDAPGSTARPVPWE